MESLSERDIYLARFGWHAASSGLALCGLAVVAFACLGGLVLWLALVIGAVGAVVFVVFAGMAGSRGPALRVDPEGVTLGGGPLRFGRIHPTHVPWPDIEAIVLWTRRLPAGATVRYIGLRVRADAEAPGPAGPALRVRGIRGPAPRAPRIPDLPSLPNVPNVPADVVALSRAVHGWRLDRSRLQAAVTAFAPGHVRVVEAP
ncbi:hypothetical protein [Streptomyces sp. MP131-18]|uniref:hypothetical protein n=1 Tax=Streptomyces sp. MP131-18 TaxID=1857892 RepID=UPI00097C6A1A|nr:hypothetical protein [Streptomyces sp. MP131-18]